MKITTTYQVWRELDEDHRDSLKEWKEDGTLNVLMIRENFIKETQSKELSSSLSITDLSVWYIADKNDDILLTSDGKLRSMAKRFNIKTHGLLWIFDQMHQEEILQTEQLISKLEHIFNQNDYYRTDDKLFNAFERLKHKWRD